MTDGFEVVSDGIKSVAEGIKSVAVDIESVVEGIKSAEAGLSFDACVPIIIPEPVLDEFMKSREKIRQQVRQNGENYEVKIA